MQSVYVETTIPSYLAARQSSQPSIAFDQQATREWWDQERTRFRLFTSAFTIDECSRGDASAAELPWPSYPDCLHTRNFDATP